MLDADLDEFRETRVQVARMILDRRRQQVTGQEHRAWPRHVSGDVCRYCQYADWCLSGIVPDTQHPPAGFVFGEKFPELQEKPQ